MEQQEVQNMGQGMPEPQVQQGPQGPQMILPYQNMQQPEMMQPNMQAVQGIGVPQNANVSALGSAAMTANQISPVSPNRDVPTSTQSTLLISELRDNVVIMKDGSFRAVVACKSINFDLMSDV